MNILNDDRGITLMEMMIALLIISLIWMAVWFTNGRGVVSPLMEAKPVSGIGAGESVASTTGDTANFTAADPASVVIENGGISSPTTGVVLDAENNVVKSFVMNAPKVAYNLGTFVPSVASEGGGSKGILPESMPACVVDKARLVQRLVDTNFLTMVTDADGTTYYQTGTEFTNRYSEDPEGTKSQITDMIVEVRAEIGDPTDSETITSLGDPEAVVTVLTGTTTPKADTPVKTTDMPACITDPAAIMDKLIELGYMNPSTNIVTTAYVTVQTENPAGLRSILTEAVNQTIVELTGNPPEPETLTADVEALYSALNTNATVNSVSLVATP